MRALVLCTLLAGFASVAFLACNPNSIGRPCVNPQGSDVRGTQISSPALECPSRLCLIQPPNETSTADGGAQVARATCTAFCNTNDDCAPENRGQCSDFVCAVVKTVGDFCCQKVCVCRGDLVPNQNVDVDGGVITPPACRPETYQGSTPACPNIKVQ
jgi:hypothetical protein